MKAALLTLLAVTFSVNLLSQQTIKESVYFDVAKYNLTTNAQKKLQNCYEKIKNIRISKITIIGHTDAEGSFSYNMALSKNRSLSVCDFFVSKGINKYKIIFKYFGEYKPVASNNSEENKQKNRRVSIIIEQGVPNIYELFDKQAQVFQVPANRDTKIICNEGTIIIIKANSLVYAKTGKSVTGNVKIAVKEYYKMSDILLSGLSTTSNGKMLETAGMINISATANKQKCKLKTGETVEISVPTTQKKYGMQLFTGQWQDDKTVNWVPQDQSLNNKQVYTVPEEKPRYLGGMKKINAFLQNNIEFPEKVLLFGLRDTMEITMTITKTGKVSKPVITKSTTPAFDAAVLNAITEMPNWIPGKVNGQNVSAEKILPINFIIKGEYASVDEYNKEMARREAIQAFRDSVQKYRKRLQVYRDSVQVYRDSVQAYADSVRRAYVDSLNKITEKRRDAYKNMYNVFNSINLGWINFDKYQNIAPKIKYTVQLDKSVYDLKVIFNNYNAIMSGVRTLNMKAYTFNNVPSGEKVTIVAYRWVDDTIYLAIKHTTTSKAVEKELVFKPVTLSGLEAAIEKLNGV